MHWSGRIYIRVAPFQMLLDIQRTIYLFFHILVYCSLWTHWNFPQKWPLELNIKYDLLHAPLLIDSHHLSIWYGSLEQTTFYTKSRMHNHPSSARYMLHAFPSKKSCYGAQYARRIVLFYEGHGGEIVGLYERRSCLPFVLCIPYCPYVGVQFSTDEEKINFALTYLSGVAQDWFEVALQ